MKNAEHVQSVLQRFVPEKAISYCFDLWHASPFDLRLSRARQSRLGDYTWMPQEKLHLITINKDLNPYSFLITYVHEVAHLVTGERHGHRIKPHGEEWKNVYKELLYPILRDDIFPEELLFPLHQYLTNPKASSCSDTDLLKALDRFDNKPLKAYLSDVKIGETFRFGKKYFVKESLKRTRALCREIPSGHRYYVPEAVQVDIIQKQIF